MRVYIVLYCQQHTYTRNK